MAGFKWMVLAVALLLFKLVSFGLSHYFLSVPRLAEQKITRSAADDGWQCWRGCDRRPAVNDLRSSLSFDGVLLLPPPQTFHAPPGKVFAHLVHEAQFPVHSGEKPSELARLFSLDSSFNSSQGDGAGIQIDGGYLAAAEVYDSGRGLETIGGHADDWMPFLERYNNSGDVDDIRFSTLVWQPVPTELDVAVDAKVAALLRKGDTLRLVYARQGATFPLHIMAVVQTILHDSGWHVRLQPVEDSRFWISFLYNGATGSGDFAQHPQYIEILPEEKAVQQQGPWLVPETALTALQDGSGSLLRPVLWMKYSNYYLPVPVRDRGRWQGKALVDLQWGGPGQTPLPSAWWQQLTPWQRFDVLHLIDYGKSPLQVFEYGQLQAQPQTNWRPGLYAQGLGSTRE